MLRKLISFTVSILVFFSQYPDYAQTTANAPEILWEKKIGGADTNELARCVQETLDGGYIIVGWKGVQKEASSSKGPGGMGGRLGGRGGLGGGGRLGSGSGSGKGMLRDKEGKIKQSQEKNSDIYLVKTDSSGNILWEKTFGGSGMERGFAVQQTSDNGFVVAATKGDSGDISKDEDTSSSSADVYLVKTDSNGNIKWEKTYGGSSAERANFIQQTSDGGYILTGMTRSFGSGKEDIYLIKTDSSGNKIWEKAFGKEKSDWGRCVRQTTDGGFIVVGTMATGFGRLSPKGKHTEITDIYVIKTDSNGNTEWEKTYGEEGDERAYSVKETSDGGYIIGGVIDPAVENKNDFYLLKLDKSGNVMWDKPIGEADRREWCFVIDVTQDGGYFLAGETHIGPLGQGADLNVWAVRTDADGNVLWTKEIIGSTGERMNDWARGAQQTRDGSYILAGMTTASSNRKDLYLIKLAADK